MKSLRQLGGWHRLWIVLALAWTIGVGISTWKTWPDFFTQYEIREDGALAHPRTGPEAAQTALMLWLVPPVTIYGLVLAGRWVYRGFRQDAATRH